MPQPNLPTVASSDAEQTEVGPRGHDTTMPLSHGFARSYRGRGREALVNTGSYPDWAIEIAEQETP